MADNLAECARSRIAGGRSGMARNRRNGERGLTRTGKLRMIVETRQPGDLELRQQSRESQQPEPGERSSGAVRSSI